MLYQPSSAYLLIYVQKDTIRVIRAGRKIEVDIAIERFIGVPDGYSAGLITPYGACLPNGDRLIVITQIR